MDIRVDAYDKPTQGQLDDEDYADRCADLSDDTWAMSARELADFASMKDSEAYRVLNAAVERINELRVEEGY